MPKPKLPSSETASGLKKFDPDAVDGPDEGAIDGDLNWEFQLQGAEYDDSRKCITDGKRVYVWPHDRDVAKYRAMGYRVEEISADSDLRPNGMEDAKPGERLRVRDHNCMSVPIEVHDRRERARRKKALSTEVVMRKQNERDIRLQA